MNENNKSDSKNDGLGSRSGDFKVVGEEGENSKDRDKSKERMNHSMN